MAEMSCEMIRNRMPLLWTTPTESRSFQELLNMATEAKLKDRDEFEVKD